MLGKIQPLPAACPQQCGYTPCSKFGAEALPLFFNGLFSGAHIRGKKMCFCSQLKVCSKRLVGKLSAGSGSAVCFDTTVVPHDF